MRMRRLVAAGLIAATLGAPARAQLPALGDGSGEEIAIDAEALSYDQPSNTVTARGGVVIKRGETEVRAETVRVNRSTNEVFATGGVAVSDPEGVLFAQELRLNLDEETGVLRQGSVKSNRLRYSLSGDLIEKGLGQSYRIENGKFTTCQCDEGAPSWSIAGKEVEVALGGYGSARGATFNILDVPIFYVPRAAFPVSRERQSGLLLPRFSASSRRGFQVLAPFYWAINRSQDLTLAADFETGARTGLVGEYRYALSRDFAGEISPSYFNEFFRGASTKTVRRNIADPDIPNDRWSLVAEHTNGIGSAKVYADLFLTGDDSFLREINTFTFDRSRDVAIRTLPFTASRVGALQSWQRSALRVQGTFYQDLVERDGLTVQRLPDVEWWGQQVFGGRLLAQMNVSGSDFQRRDGIDGLRLDVHPEAALPLPLGAGFFGSVRAGLRETAYHLTQTESADGLNGTQPGQFVRLPANRTRELFHLSAEAGTSLSRVYAFEHMGVSKLKHTIEPLVEYTFVPGVDQDELPVFDGEDRDNRRSLFTYGVVSRLLAKHAPEPAATVAAAPGSAARNVSANSVAELARLSLTQSFDTEREIEPVTGQGTAGTADHFSDVALGLRVQPSSALSLRAHTDYDTSVADVSSASVGFRVRGAGRADSDDSVRLETRNALGVTYRFITRSLLQQIDSTVQLRLTDTLGFVYAGRVDVQNNRFLENYFGVRLLSQCDCWGFEFAVVDKSNPEEVEARVQFTLVGLGSAGELRPATSR
ncbi:MAG: LPS-assembly protein LptD [Deltaproteobacteria bacterium]|nr:LPS-assembly protein LptD [Deltaproteobacteria bacterium]